MLVHYLAPTVYGEVADASVLVLSANQFSTLGVGMYVVTKRNEARAAIFHATLLHFLLGALALAFAILLRQPLGRYMHAPDMGPFVIGLVASVLIDRVSFVPERLLVRDLRFRAVGLGRTVGELSYTLVSVGAAVGGLGGMSIVWGNIARSLLRAVWMIGANHRRDWFEWGPIDFKRFSEIARYGLPVALTGIATFAARRWDNGLMSHYFGVGMGGLYTLAYNLADIPAVQVGEQLTDVMLSAFVHWDRGQRSEALRRSLPLIALVMFPLGVGLGVVAPTLARVGVNDRWIAVGPMLACLSALSITRPIAGALGAHLAAAGRNLTILIVEASTAIGVILGIAASWHFGALTACVAVGVVFALRAFALAAALARLEAVPLGQLLGGLAAPLCACLPMVAAILLWRNFFPAVAPRFELGIELALGAVLYPLSALLIAGPSTRDLIALGRQAIAKRAASKDQPL